MANVLSAKLAGKTGKPHGIGMKIVAGKIDLPFKAGIQSISAAELGLKSLTYLSVSPGTLTDRVIQTNVELPGSMDNAATVAVYDIGATVVITTNGTLEDTSYLAIGE